jgi:hypothetical protein
VVNMQTIDGLIGMVDHRGNATDTPTTIGSVADSRNTEGLTPAQIVQVLGLDYNNSPYVTGNADGSFTPVDQLFYIEAPTTQQMVDAVQVPLHADIRARMAALAENNATVAHVLARSQDLNPGFYGDAMDPFTGMGFTAPGERLPGGQVTLNQELKASPVSIPSGSQIFQQLPSGQNVLIATLVQDFDGTRHWVISGDCPAEMRPRFDQLAATGMGNSQSVRSN